MKKKKGLGGQILDLRSVLKEDNVAGLAVFGESRHPELLRKAIHDNAVQCVSYLLQLNPVLLAHRGDDDDMLVRAMIKPYHDEDWEDRLHILEMIVNAGSILDVMHDASGYSILNSLFRKYEHSMHDENVDDGSVLRYLGWWKLCAHVLVDAGADTSLLPRAHPFRLTPTYYRALSARVALYKALLIATRLPRDVARLVVCHLQGQWLEWK